MSLINHLLDYLIVRMEALTDVVEKSSEKSVGFLPKWDRSYLQLEELFSVDDGRPFIGREVIIQGWVRFLRKQAKDTLAFLSVNDGSTATCLQVLAKQNEEHTTEGFEEALTASMGSSVWVKGQVIESPAKGQAIELVADQFRVVGSCDATKYPIGKRNTFEHLRTIPHLRMRTAVLGAVTRVRNTLISTTHEFFQQRRFLNIHTPILTAADCEGAGETFGVSTLLPEAGSSGDLPRTPEGKVDYSQELFKQSVGLTVSGQLQVESFAVAMGDVYTFGPTFRAEESHTNRHLAEFWMIEPEIVHAGLKEDMDLAEDYLKFITQEVLKRHPADLKLLDQVIEKGLVDRLIAVVESDFERITYTQAIEILTQPEHLTAGKFERMPKWGIDLGSEHEKYLTEKIFKKPVFVTNYPRKIKAFYMLQNSDGETVDCMDLLVPQIGELVGGSARETDAKRLEERMMEVGLTKDAMPWYFDLREYGSVPHAGFGVGFERLVMYMTGISNIRESIPFPRYPGHCDG